MEEAKKQQKNKTTPPKKTTNKADCHDITEILLKVALNTINQNQTIFHI
jgi:hypothetical protein